MFSVAQNMKSVQLALAFIVWVSCIIVDCKLFGSKVRSGPTSAVYAVYDANTPAQIAYDEETLNYSSFNTHKWKQRLNSKGISISINDLNEIENSVKNAIIAGYAKYTTYVRPDNINGATGGFIFGAWKVEVYVNQIDDIWKYRIIQGEKHVICKQNMHKKECDYFFGIKSCDSWDWTENRSCTMNVISGLVNNVLDDIDKQWKNTYIRSIAHGHTEL